MIAQLKGIPLGDALFLPRVMFRADQLVFLDDLLPQDIERELEIKVIVCEGDGASLIKNIKNLRR